MPRLLRRVLARRPPRARLSAASAAACAIRPRPELAATDGAAPLAALPVATACRDSVRRLGYCVLRGVMSAAEAEACAADAQSRVSRGESFYREGWHTPYLAYGDGGGGTPQRSAKHLIAYDQVADGSPLRELYARDQLLHFVAHVLGLDTPLYRSADPLGAAYLNVYGEGDELGWHYDESAFFVSVLLRAPHAGGGEFHYVPDSNAAAAVLEGAPDAPAPLRLSDVGVGDMLVFRGSRVMHRVTPVAPAGGPRVNAIMTFESEPGRALSSYTREKFFGR